MGRLLSADIFRIFRSKWFWLCLSGMLAMAVAFMMMQYTAMDYTVPLSRVIFLPLSFYGMAVAALVSLFVGEDFNDGFIRNKIIAGHTRRNIFASNLIAGSLACMVIYMVVTLFTASLGCLFFEMDVFIPRFLQYLAMGMGMCLAYESIYCSISMVCGNKTTAIILCMILAFFLLFACLHTNQVMVQPEYKDGLANPAYVDGFAKAVYGFLHDLNPYGQAAQLSAMDIFQPARWIFCDILWFLFAGVGYIAFKGKDIR